MNKRNCTLPTAHWPRGLCGPQVTTHFGEISSFWDFMLGTSDIYADGRAAGYAWHLTRHRERRDTKRAE